MRALTINQFESQEEVLGSYERIAAAVIQRVLAEQTAKPAAEVLEALHTAYPFAGSRHEENPQYAVWCEQVREFISEPELPETR